MCFLLFKKFVGGLASILGKPEGSRDTSLAVLFNFLGGVGLSSFFNALALSAFFKAFALFLLASSSAPPLLLLQPFSRSPEAWLAHMLSRH